MGNASELFVKNQKNSAKKVGKRSVSHRYNLLPLLPSGPDGVQRELVVRDLPMLTQDPALLLQVSQTVVGLEGSARILRFVYYAGDKIKS